MWSNDTSLTFRALDACPFLQHSDSKQHRAVGGNRTDRSLTNISDD
jgi:hypothetical protein